MRLILVDKEEVKRLLGVPTPCRGSLKPEVSMSSDATITAESLVESNSTNDSFPLKPIKIDISTLGPKRVRIRKPRKDYHKDQSRYNHLRVMYRPMYFIDGEGVNLDDDIIGKKGVRFSPQRYALFTAIDPDGNHGIQLIGEGGIERIPSKLILQALLNLPKNTTKFSFSFDYDVSNILHDMPENRWERLLKRQQVKWDKYNIRYTPHKQFIVSSLKSRGSKRAELSCCVWDSAGFSQGSFEKAIAEWNVATDEDKAIIKAGKAGRGGFTKIDQSVIAYNAMEGVLGCRIFREILDGSKDIGLSLRRFDGAGAVAGAMLRKHSVQPYIHQKEPLPTDLMLKGYVGGRFDINGIGTFPKAWEYDINSAYPSIIRNLPCLTHSTWKYQTDYIKDKHSFWHVKWNLDSPLWSPLPWRDYKNSVPHYFANGEGWYYGHEVQAALELYPGIEILEGYTLVKDCEHKPFAFIDYYFEKRAALKLENKTGPERVIKLGLNSLYGKTAQTKTGFDHQGKPIIPANQCLIWAGMITSEVRGMILEAIALNPSAVRVIATDAVISTSPLGLPLGTELGKWGVKELTDFTVVRNGVYGSENRDASGKRIKFASRSYSATALERQWNTIKEGFASELPFSVMVDHTEFIKCSTAIERKNWNVRNTWVNQPKELTVCVPEDKTLVDGYLIPRSNPDQRSSNVFKVTDDKLRLDDYEDTRL